MFHIDYQRWLRGCGTIELTEFSKVNALKLNSNNPRPPSTLRCILIYGLTDKVDAFAAFHVI
ncbi:hypothetical protein AC482_01945 [miscellaneous Crenarchaeota group-15 archaeon DG-45]|uniref:Uncharacterized protein n=1 Tax=miscellaneous Crenarchaeota group-15 archaeon DG-45 TaxID=1685127 RepID=A0A0M0BR89_9ARCH|nr:MAG: hypothetical protein AC482_01945 [miscellaneous Crenarchaeota group-15 archaeon DG-45]